MDLVGFLVLSDSGIDRERQICPICLSGLARFFVSELESRFCTLNQAVGIDRRFIVIVMCVYIRGFQLFIFVSP